MTPFVSSTHFVLLAATLCGWTLTACTEVESESPVAQFRIQSTSSKGELSTFLREFAAQHAFSFKERPFGTGGSLLVEFRLESDDGLRMNADNFEGGGEGYVVRIYKGEGGDRWQQLKEEFLKAAAARSISIAPR